jgi:prolyl-tRNA synthetase
MAIPVLSGRKSEGQKFPGAVTTYTIEALMQDGKALQAGTSHYLGQNFAKAVDVQFQNRDKQLEYVYATSWGVSTRLVGALVMSHSDDAGLVLPPSLAPLEVVVVPILKSDADKTGILAAACRVAETLGEKVRLRVDDRDNVSPGWKFNEWELKGVPIRIEIGPKDVAAGQVVIVRRDTGQKTPIGQDAVAFEVPDLLRQIQESLLAKAKDRLQAGCRSVDSYDEFKKVLEEAGGFVFAPWCGSAECEARASEETKATLRLIPDQAEEALECMLCGKGPAKRVPFALAY